MTDLLAHLISIAEIESGDLWALQPVKVSDGGDSEDPWLQRWDTYRHSRPQHLGQDSNIVANWPDGTDQFS